MKPAFWLSRKDLANCSTGSRRGERVKKKKERKISTLDRREAFASVREESYEKSLSQQEGSMSIPILF